MFQICDIIILILLSLTLILNIIIIYKLYHINITIHVISSKNINNHNNDNNDNDILYDTIKPIEKTNIEKTTLKNNNMDFSTKTKKDIYYYKNNFY